MYHAKEIIVQLIGDAFQSNQPSQNPRRQNLSNAQVVWRKTTEEEIEAFKAIQQLIKTFTTVMWKIDKDDFSTINQLGYNVAKIVKQLLSTSTV